MGNALFGVPQDYTVTASSGSNVVNCTNDEPGLVYSGNPTVTLDFDVTDDDPIAVLAVLGVVPGQTFNWYAATSNADRTAGTYSWSSGPKSSNFSTRRIAEDAKHLTTIPTARTERYWRLVVTGGGLFEPWRVLLCKRIMPWQNIEVGASSGIDDRSDRRYARSGRRVIDPTVICPSFQGGWPWLEEDEYREDIRPMMRDRGGTHPVLFVYDFEDTTRGEDEMIYGDLEKTQNIGHEDGQLWSYSFTIVAIAP